MASLLNGYGADLVVEADSGTGDALAGLLHAVVETAIGLSGAGPDTAADHREGFGDEVPVGPDGHRLALLATPCPSTRDP